MNTYPIERRAANRLPPMPVPDDAFGLRSAVDSVLQHGRLFLGVLAGVMMAAVTYSLLATPIYKADTLLQIDTRTRGTLLPGMPGSERSGVDAERPIVSGELEVLASRELLLPVITDVGADVQVSGARRFGILPIGARHGIEVVEFRLPASHQRRDFGLTVEAGQWELADPGGQVLSRGNVGSDSRFRIGTDEARLRVMAAADGPRTRLTLRQESPMAAYEDVIKRLRMFEPSRDSGLVRISYEDSHAQRAAAFLNGLSAQYLERAVRRKQAESERALTAVEAQIPGLRARVEVAENALSRYQKGSRVAPVGVESDALLRRRGDLERQAVELRIRRDLLAQNLTPEHPDVAAVLQQIGTVEESLARLSGDAGRLPVQHRDVVRLEREVQTETQLYAAMLNHAQQLRMLGTGWQPLARQLDRAAVPIEPTRPKVAAVLSVGAAAGLVLGLVAVMLARAFQPTISNAHDLQSPVSPPTLAVIPESPAQLRLMEGRLADDAVIDDLGTHRLLARAAPDDPAVESLRSVHLSLMLRARSMTTQVIMVTSPSAGTGKSFVAANLATLMADAGRRVLLIEADLRKPGIHRLVGIDEFAAGLTDLLAQTHSLDEVIHHHVSVDMDVILHGTVTQSAGTLLLSQGLESALAELRSRYDHIIINASPLLPSRDALAVGRVADFAVMVVRPEQSLLQETRAALQRLEQSGIRLEGLLFNGVKSKRLNAPVVT